MANFIQLNGGSAYLVTDDFGYETAEKLRNDLALLVQGQVGRNRWVGGSDSRGLLASAAVDIIDALHFKIDNSSTQWSGSTGITVPITVLLRVANASISVTPRIWNYTTAAAATISGAAACSATATDWSGTNQIQTLLLTLASGINEYCVQVTPTAATYPVFVKAWQGMYI